VPTTTAASPPGPTAPIADSETSRCAPSPAEGWTWFRDALDELLPLAESLGVRIVLEPQTRYNSDMLNTIDETVAFIRSFGTASLAFEADVHHQALEERSLLSTIVVQHNLASDTLPNTLPVPNLRNPFGIALIPMPGLA